jgi:hypothetical protein
MADEQQQHLQIVPLHVEQSQPTDVLLVSAALYTFWRFDMKRNCRFTEGPGPDRELFDLYTQFEELCEIEGPGAADEGDLSRLKQEMTAAWLRGDKHRFVVTERLKLGHL